jgi:hypothetical protein
MNALAIHSASVHLPAGGLPAGGGSFGRALLQPGQARPSQPAGEEFSVRQRVEVRPHRQAPPAEPVDTVRRTGDARTQLYADHEAIWPGRSWRYINFLI